VSRHIQDPGEVVVDIETVAPGFSELDVEMREYLTERAIKRARWDGKDLTADEAEEVAADRLAMDTGLARVVAVGMRGLQKNGSLILLDSSGEQDVAVPGALIERHDEPTMMARFWELLERPGTRRTITFNGRGFDGPNLMVRSAIYGVSAGRNLCGYRYDIGDHCDLSDCLSFLGATRGNYTLDYWCRAFGIPSPKESGIDGSDVGRLFRNGEMQLIATYLADDLLRTGQLYDKCRHFLWCFKGGPARPYSAAAATPELALR